MQQTSKPAKAARLAMFGPPPLIIGEDADAYEELLARVSADVEPKDILEEIWVRDIVDLAWGLLRLRRLKAGLFNANAYPRGQRIQDQSKPRKRASQHRPEDR
jgi:hypothetical protein